jgi:hypothetical protein
MSRRAFLYLIALAVTLACFHEIAFDKQPHNSQDPTVIFHCVTPDFPETEICGTPDHGNGGCGEGTYIATEYFTGPARAIFLKEPSSVRALIAVPFPTYPRRFPISVHALIRPQRQPRRAFLIRCWSIDVIGLPVTGILTLAVARGAIPVVDLQSLSIFWVMALR